MSTEQALITAQRAQIASGLAGLLPADELNKKVNEVLEKELCSATAGAINEIAQGWAGTRGQRLGKAIALMRVLTLHLSHEADAVRADLAANQSVDS